MTNPKDKPLFPDMGMRQRFRDEQPFLVIKEGISIREYYAGLAMQAILAGCYTNPNAEQIPEDWLSSEAVKHAEALIDALEDQADD